jgi:hypothetical protein
MTARTSRNWQTTRRRRRNKENLGEHPDNRYRAIEIFIDKRVCYGASQRYEDGRGISFHFIMLFFRLTPARVTLFIIDPFNYTLSGKKKYPVFFVRCFLFKSPFILVMVLFG